MIEKQFFNTISDSEKSSLISYIQENNVECTFKIDDTYSKSYFLKSEKNSIQIFKKKSFPIDSEKIVVTFESIGDLFFFESIAKTTSDESDNQKLLIDLPNQIYKLQRRNDFRVTIPSHLRPVIKIKNYPDLKIEIRDLSLGGCKLSVQTEFKLDLTLDSETEINLKILDFDEKNLNVIIKFLDHIQDAKTMILGLQFIELNSEQTALMRNTLLQLDRLLRHKSGD